MLFSGSQTQLHVSLYVDTDVSEIKCYLMSCVCYDLFQEESMSIIVRIHVKYIFH